VDSCLSLRESSVPHLLGFTLLSRSERRLSAKVAFRICWFSRYFRGAKGDYLRKKRSAFVGFHATFAERKATICESSVPHLLVFTLLSRSERRLSAKEAFRICWFSRYFRGAKGDYLRKQRSAFVGFHATFAERKATICESSVPHLLGFTLLSRSERRLSAKAAFRICWVSRYFRGAKGDYLRKQRSAFVGFHATFAERKATICDYLRLSV
jgi:hypothetical protein